MSQGKLKEGGVSPAVEGQLVPDFELEDQHGKAYRLSDFEGNIVFLNFWATWCAPCVEELPMMDSLNNKLRAKEFTMIAVSVDESWEEIKRFVQTLNREPTFLILRDPNKTIASKIYGSEMFPETYVIGKDRKLLKKYKGIKNWLDEKQVAFFESHF